MKTNFRLAQIVKHLVTSGFLAMLFLSFAAPVQAQTRYERPADLARFIERVRNGNAATLRGVYIQNVLHFLVIQQPQGDEKFVSLNPAVVTQFELATRTGNIGLLAHNNLAGKSFKNINLGNKVILVYGDGHTEVFQVNQILAYQVLPYGQYQNLETQEITGIGGIFNTAYNGEYHLTLQTCIANGDNQAWGRLFVIATPIEP